MHPAMAPKSKHCTDSVAEPAQATTSPPSIANPPQLQLPSAASPSSQLQPPTPPTPTVFWVLPPFQLLQPEPKPGCNCYELGQLATWLGYWLFGWAQNLIINSLVATRRRCTQNSQLSCCCCCFLRPFCSNPQSQSQSHCNPRPAAACRWRCGKATEAAAPNDLCAKLFRKYAKLALVQHKRG